MVSYSYSAPGLAAFEFATSRFFFEDKVMLHSPYTDPELTDWLRWAYEGGEVPTFYKAIAEAAFLADLENYALLRPVLLELKRKRPILTQLSSSFDR